MQFKLGDVSLKSPSTFRSGGEFLQVRSAHRITAWPSQTDWGKGNIAISSFTYPYRALSHLWFTLLLHSFSSDHFHRRLSARIRPSVSLWDETELHSQPPGSPLLFCLSNHEPADIYFWYLEVALGNWPNLIGDSVGKASEVWKVLLVAVLEIHGLRASYTVSYHLQRQTSDIFGWTAWPADNLYDQKAILQCAKHMMQA